LPIPDRFLSQASRSLVDRDGRQWRSDNPAAGQCSVTALVVQDELGGEILKTDVNGAWHFYNQIDGRRVDFTVSQFDSPIGYDDVTSNRLEALDDTSAAQYQRLLGLVRSSRVAGKQAL
jgi:hypothetical protein